jgi:hypothetical protein
LGTSTILTDRGAIEAGLAILQAGGDFTDGVISWQGAAMGADFLATRDKNAVALFLRRRPVGRRAFDAPGKPLRAWLGKVCRQEEAPTAGSDRVIETWLCETGGPTNCAAGRRRLTDNLRIPCMITEFHFCWNLRGVFTRPRPKPAGQPVRYLCHWRTRHSSTGCDLYHRNNLTDLVIVGVDRVFTFPIP